MTVQPGTLQHRLHAFGISAALLRLSDGSQLEILDVVRTVPGKRLVCRCMWNALCVYAKIFVGHDARRYAGRDERGVMLLQQAGIKTPPLLCTAELVGGQGSVLVFAEVADALNAEQACLAMDADAKFRLASLLVKAVAHHHRSRLLQTDLYLKNFLVKHDEVYTLDGDGIRALPPLFQKRRQLHNLATLFSKFDALDDAWVKTLYAEYCVQSGMVQSTVDEARVCYWTQKIRHQVASGYADKKVFRSCTDVKMEQSFSYFKAVAAGFNVADDALESLDFLLAAPQANIKNGNTCTVAKAVLAGRPVIIKRYNIKSFWHGLSRAVRRSRAAQSWANAHRLLILNVATPKPLALVEERIGFLRRRAYFLSEYIDAPDVKQYFAKPAAVEDKKAVAQNLALLFYKLYLLKISHGDCKASNIKILGLQPVLIDLDAMQANFTCWLGYWFGDWRFKRQHAKDLVRFMQNWEDDMETRHLLRHALQQVYAKDAVEALFRAGIA